MKRLRSASEINERQSSDAEGVVAAIYVNYFELGHNPFEFLIDFGQFHPGIGDGDGTTAIHSRIALAPPYAKMLSELLAQSVGAYEVDNGPIAVVGPPVSSLDAVLSPFSDFEERARQLRTRDPHSASAQFNNDR